MGCFIVLTQSYSDKSSSVQRRRGRGCRNAAASHKTSSKCFFLLYSVCLEENTSVCTNQKKKSHKLRLTRVTLDNSVQSGCHSFLFSNFIIIKAFKLKSASTSAGDKFPPGTSTDGQIHPRPPCSSKSNPHLPPSTSFPAGVT